MNVSKKDREVIKNKFNGKCAYCGCELGKGWHADHIKSINRYSELVRDEKGRTIRDEKGNAKRIVKIDRPENDNIENINPACASCNINKHNLSIEDFRKLIQGFMNSLNLRSTPYKFIKKYGLVEETGKPVVFYFEKYEVK